MKTKIWSRLGALFIDNILIFALALGILINLGLSAGRAVFFTSLTFLLYTVLIPSLCRGFHLGKFMLGMKIVTDRYRDPSVPRMVARELSKVLYAIPFAGIVFLIISQFLMSRREDGKSLHDLIAHTQVIHV